MGLGNSSYLFTTLYQSISIPVAVSVSRAHAHTHDSPLPNKPRPVELPRSAVNGALPRGPAGAGERLARDVAVDVDVAHEGVEGGVVLLVAHEAQDEQAQGGRVEVGGEVVQHVHLGRPHRVLVEGVVADGHDHGVDLPGRGGWGLGLGCGGGGGGG